MDEQRNMSTTLFPHALFELNLVALIKLTFNETYCNEFSQLLIAMTFFVCVTYENFVLYRD